ncbi:P-loop containing nucleoside triphosphate hydrolase protein [Neohortaea acidophila]|uniref:P-loop containing nucleoside triphosphate hydrolase protein n=1 Tax=Neohortaea acidophila TaxID=245834 RepID=A0A6A6PVR0_9PEZI|nr:P-loop containing nucleoside triphosphate hydrolase protein [Neohortaea acidophila]KAF2484122.1 P-loop containing nucleoside triphosphate hydrolase protein [Neohortaea acidophila]
MNKNINSMRPPPVRPGASRAQSATPTLTGRASPADSLKVRTPKRKPANEVEQDIGGEETNINVVVRCRGRNDREVRENSGVVVSTDGVKGKKVELSMGPSALSNKTYSFDKVFSPAADQGIIFQEVVSPILDEVLNGFNCTIFAYGQTGTGKTYTMSGDITDMLPIPDEAGIVPRVLHNLFDRLGEEASDKYESSVKCSFIELYNEELRDLLAADDGGKLKIFDEANKNGRTTTMVQGMEETHIKTATKGIQLLREGSHKRQVAATKCNDLSSRSHTVFTVTVYMKRTSETGEDFVSSGKLNLVDLAGSENIQRSGAENKRAAEAGVINKSLLTLGRVINALVDKSSHIPYRESKLTRLLQDSLGGRTKTCIIATLSPAKSNLEETISTLDYAFRAKNIRNKPQVNQMVSKKTLLKEFTAEIEKLKSELIATRQRNGVYLTAESYEEITTESESRRILSEEQRDRIETMEANLRNRVQELFHLTTNFQSLKRDNEQVRANLDGAKDVLSKTEIVLAHTKRNLAEETHIRKAHQQTEEQLAAVGEDLLSTLTTTTDHVGRLHSKLRRRSDLQSINRSRWANTTSQVSDVASDVEGRLEEVRSHQQGLIASLSERMQSFVSDELRELQASKSLLHEKSAAFAKSQSEVNSQTSIAKEEMNTVLGEINTLRDDVKQKVGAGLNDLSAAAQRIVAGIAGELDSFHSQLQSSYVSLGREFKATFEDLVKQMSAQQAEVQRLRQQVTQAGGAFVAAGQASQEQLQQAVQAERQTAARERTELLGKIAALIDDSAAVQETRFDECLENASKRIKTSESEYRVAQQTYGDGMDRWSLSAEGLVSSTMKSRDTIKAKLKSDWSTASAQTTKLTETTNAVHSETVRIVDDQMAQMDGQLVALDEIITRVRAQNEEHHTAHTSSLHRLASNVEESYQSIGTHFDTSYNRTQALEKDMRNHSNGLEASTASLHEDGDIRQPLRHLREDVASAIIEEYTATGETPAKTHYSYPTALPRTEPHEVLLDRMRGGSGAGTAQQPQLPSSLRSPKKSPRKNNAASPYKARSSPVKPSSSPVKPLVLADTPPPLNLQLPASDRPQTSHSLRELDVNITATAGLSSTTSADAEGGVDATLGAGGKESKILAPHLLRRQNTNPTLSSSQMMEGGAGAGRLPVAKRSAAARMTVAGVAEGRENAVPHGAAVNLSASIGPGGVARRLRSRGSD